MIAACAQELKQYNQAQYALNKAIELDENQPLAYQVVFFALDFSKMRKFNFQGMIQLGERAPGFLTDGDIGSSFRKLCSLTRTSYVSFKQKFIGSVFIYFSDANKFFDYAKKYIEYLKKQITSNVQTDSYRIQIAELCRDIVNEKQLQLNPDDEKTYRLLSIEILQGLKTIPTPLNEFVCLIKFIFIRKLFFDIF